MHVPDDTDKKWLHIYRVSCIQMKKLFLLLALGGFATPAFADITHRMTSSTQLQVNAAATQVSRIGSTYSSSGSGVTLDVAGGNSADNLVGGFKTVASGAVTDWHIPTATAAANSTFSFANSFTAGDASTATGTNATTYTAGAAGTAAPGLITNAHTVTIAGGTEGAGSGSTVTGQFVSEVTIFD